MDPPRWGHDLRRVYDANMFVYGAAKIWTQLNDEGVEFATMTYVDWFNHRRLHGACQMVCVGAPHPVE